MVFWSGTPKLQYYQKQKTNKHTEISYLPKETHELVWGMKQEAAVVADGDVKVDAGVVAVGEEGGPVGGNTGGAEQTLLAVEASAGNSEWGCSSTPRPPLQPGVLGMQPYWE